MSYPIDFQTETAEARWNDCTFASGAMLADFAWGADVPYENIRKASGLPANHSGANLDNLVAGYDNLGLPHNALVRPANVLAFSTLLGMWWGAVVQVDYGRLPKHYGRWDMHFWTNHGYHAAFVYGYDANKVMWCDPLGRGDYAGEPLAFKDLTKALLTWNGQPYVLAGKGVPMTAYLDAAPSKVRVTKRGRMYRYPSTLAPADVLPVGEYEKVGVQEGNSNWLLLRIPHGNLGVTRWVPKSAVA